MILMLILATRSLPARAQLPLLLSDSCRHTSTWIASMLAITEYLGMPASSMDGSVLPRISALAACCE
jgi:hypothetical protein